MGSPPPPKEGGWEAGLCREAWATPAWFPAHHTVCWHGDRVWLTALFLREETTVPRYAGSLWEHLPAKVSTALGQLGLGGHLVGPLRAHGKSQAYSAKPAGLLLEEARMEGPGRRPLPSGCEDHGVMLCTVDRCALLMNAAHD